MHTGTKQGASTDDNIFLLFYGNVCSIRDIHLNTPQNDFESGQTDQFTFDKRNVGDVSHSVLMQFLCTQTWVHDGDLNTDESQLGGGGGRRRGEGAD